MKLDKIDRRTRVRSRGHVGVFRGQIHPRLFLGDILAKRREHAGGPEKANPGKKVVQEAVGWAALNNKLQTAIATGALPDATQLEVSVGRSFMYKQLLRPMDDLLESVGRENVYPAVRALMVDERDGKTYGVSHAIGVNLLTYRKDFLKAAGLSEVAPKTFAEWLTMLKALTVDTNGDGRPDRFGLSISGTGHNINESLYTFVASNGGRLFDENGKPALTEPQVVEALRFFKEIADCCLAPDWLSSRLSWHHGRPVDRQGCHDYGLGPRSGVL